jgi:hypothetical protein
MWSSSTILVCAILSKSGLFGSFGSGRWEASPPALVVGGAARRGAEQELYSLGGQDAQYRFDDGCRRRDRR